MYLPYYAKEINISDSLNRPSTVKQRNNRSFSYWERALFQRALFSIDIEYPDIWKGRKKDFINYVLFRRGYVMVASDVMFGTFAQPCTLSGYDFDYQPVRAILSNPKLNKEYIIGKECAILKLTPDYCGIWDIIDRFAGQMSDLDNALNMSLVNSKFAWFFGAKTKGAASALRKGFDQINRGEPLAIFDQRISDDPTSKDEPFQHIDFGVKDNYITTDLLQDATTILRNFDAEIGIPTLPYDKKERLVSSEAESRFIESSARASIWVDTINESAEDIKKVFPDIIIKAKLHNDTEGVEDNGNNDDEPTGII